MTNEVAEKIVRGIKDKIQCNTADIDDWAEFWGFTREEYKEFLDMAIKALEQTRWIPVSEGLPEEDGEFLLFGKITDEDKNCIFTGEYYAWMEKFGIWQERLDIGTRDLSSDFYEYESVIAWCPLPQPYKEEQDGKNNTDND